MTGERRRVIAALWEQIQRVRPGQRALIAIDGFDGAGKTHLSEELAQHATSIGGRHLTRVHIDGFHRPRAERRAAGTGPEGFYSGSYQYDEFIRAVVDPVRGDGMVTPAIWDVVTDNPVSETPIHVPTDGIVLVDGIFLHRPELAPLWDASVWVEVPFEVSVPRGNARFPRADLSTDPKHPSNHRYVGGQRIYLEEANPRARATWVLENANLAAPSLRRLAQPLRFPRRAGERPRVSHDGPQTQLTQRSTPALWGELVARVFSLAGTVEGHSAVSPASSRAVFIDGQSRTSAPERSLAPVGERFEPVHVHGVHDTSLHLVLPGIRGAELTERGWAEPHAYADHGTEFFVYGPRTREELEVVVAIVEESLAWATSDSEVRDEIIGR